MGCEEAFLRAGARARAPQVCGWIRLWLGTVRQERRGEPCQVLRIRAALAEGSDRESPACASLELPRSPGLCNGSR